MNAPTPTLEPTPDQPGGRFRRATAIGLTAGLLGGGAVGLLFAVPSLTSAAADSAALQDTDTATDDTATDDTATEDTPRPDRGAVVRDLLQALVDDGTITAEQADAVAARLAESLPARGGRDREHGGRRGDGDHEFDGRRFDGTVVADALGIDVEALRSALQSGQSIADVAAAQGIDVQVVIDALVAEIETRTAEAVTNGRLTQEEADARLADLTERMTERVNESGGFGRGPRGPGGPGHESGTDDEADVDETTTSSEA